MHHCESWWQSIGEHIIQVQEKNTSNILRQMSWNLSTARNSGAAEGAIDPGHASALEVNTFYTAIKATLDQQSNKLVTLTPPERDKLQKLGPLQGSNRYTIWAKIN